MHLDKGELRNSLSFAELAVRRSTTQAYLANMTMASPHYVVTKTDEDGDPSEVEWRGLSFRLEVHM